MSARIKRPVRLPEWLTPIDVAWAAGLIDGEGCLGIYGLGGRKRTPRAVIRVVMTEAAGPERLYSIFRSGTVRERPPRFRRLPSFDWTVTARREVYRILCMIQPHLIVKRDQAHMLMCFLRTNDIETKRLIMRDCSAVKTKGIRSRAA